MRETLPTPAGDQTVPSQPVSLAQTTTMGWSGFWLGQSSTAGSTAQAPPQAPISSGHSWWSGHTCLAQPQGFQPRQQSH